LVNVTIDQLLSGEALRKPTLDGVFQQDSLTFKGTMSPVPPNLIPVSNQTQLESILGSDLEIPDGEARTIVYLDSFTQSKPFKLGVNSAIEIFMATNRVSIVYSGAGSFVQMTTPGTSAANLSFPGILRLTGNGTNSVFDVKVTEGVSLETLILINFQDFGTIDSPAVNFSLLVLFGFTTGIILKNAVEFGGDQITIIQTGATGITALSIIGTTPTVTNVTSLLGTLFAGDSLLFLDPNTTGTSIITNSTINLGDFYQQGTDIAINSVADNGSGKARFTTAASHGLIVGRPVVISGFVTETTYNGTFIVTAVDTPLTGTTFDVEEITFVATDTGNMNKASLDSTSPNSLSQDNAPANDSMASAQIGFTNVATPIVVSIVTQDVPVSTAGGAASFVIPFCSPGRVAINN